MILISAAKVILLIVTQVTTNVGCYLFLVSLLHRRLLANRNSFTLCAQLYVPQLIFLSVQQKITTRQRQLQEENICSSLGSSGIPPSMTEMARQQVQEDSWLHYIHRQEERSKDAGSPPGFFLCCLGPNPREQRCPPLGWVFVFQLYQSRVYKHRLQTHRFFSLRVLGPLTLTIILATITAPVPGPLVPYILLFLLLACDIPALPLTVSYELGCFPTVVTSLTQKADHAKQAVVHTAQSLAYGKIFFFFRASPQDHSVAGSSGVASTVSHMSS